MMKKIFLVGIGLLLIASFAYASPPTSIDVAYDATAKKVTAMIYHQTYNIHRHYINTVIIKLNDVVLETQRFHWQHSAAEQTAVFSIANAKPGDVVTIQAFCNKGGQLSQQIKIK
jgi:hypothetical protein